MRAGWLLLAGCALCLPAAGQVQKWVDGQGRAHYGDRPPAGMDGAKTAPLRGTVSISQGMTAVAGTGKTAPAQSGTAMPSTGQVWIYTTPTCGYCRRAEEHLRRKGVPFVEKDIKASAANMQEFRAFGGRGVPLTVAANGRLSGYGEANFDAFLKSAGF